MGNFIPKICVAYGTRPEIIKLAPVISELRARSNFSVSTVATGQHLDLAVQAEEFLCGPPDNNLGVKNIGLTLAELGGELLIKLGAFFKSQKFDLVVVHGDTSTAYFAALSAFYEKIPVAHVEAGLRTNDPYLPFPEELNRVLISKLASIHFAPLQAAKSNLLAEGISERVVFVTGNTIVDTVNDVLARSSSEELAFNNNQFLNDEVLIFATVHRRENLGEPLENICKALVTLVSQDSSFRVIFSTHPNPEVRNTVTQICGTNAQISVVSALDYPSTLRYLNIARLVITDSGGLQEEACTLNTPVLICRESTERPEVIDYGLGKLVGNDTDIIVKSASSWLESPPSQKLCENPYGDGKASIRIADILTKYFEV